MTSVCPFGMPLKRMEGTWGLEEKEVGAECVQKRDVVFAAMNLRFS
jgi:hypothetical protein